MCLRAKPPLMNEPCVIKKRKNQASRFLSNCLFEWWIQPCGPIDLAIISSLLVAMRTLMCSTPMMWPCRLAIVSKTGSQKTNSWSNIKCRHSWLHMWCKYCCIISYQHGQILIWRVPFNHSVCELLSAQSSLQKWYDKFRVR